MADEITLDELIKQLAALRFNWKIQYETAQQREEVYLKSRTYLAYAEERANLKLIEGDIDALSQNIRTLAEFISFNTNYENRHPNPYVTVKEFDVVSIIDEPAAKAWASINAPEMLTLSSKFAGVVKKLTLPFLNKKTEYHAQIDSDLTKVKA